MQCVMINIFTSKVKTSVPDKRRVSRQKPHSNHYLTQYGRKQQSAKVLLQLKYYTLCDPPELHDPLPKKIN